MFPLTRRQWLQRAGAGFGAVGLAGALESAGLLNSEARGATVPGGHFPARAKRVIFLFMNGAPSHVDTLDPKPALWRGMRGRSHRASWSERPRPVTCRRRFAFNHTAKAAW